MLSLLPEKLDSTPIGPSTAWLIGACMEARGKQELWTRQRPEVLKALREQAIVQSTESSNRIEGVTVERERLQPIVLGRSKPRDRPEEEIVGYRRALNWIFGHAGKIDIAPRTILALHKMAQGGFSGDAGQWKTRNNEIIEFSVRGERRVRFVPTPAAQVPEAIERLCLTYRDLAEADRIPSLLLAMTFVFDFLCIHPFRDGNGRVSRLLTTLLLQEQGFAVARYVSLERLVENTKEDYYAILERCSRGWHQGKNELIPWWNYALGILKRAYDEFAERVEQTSQSFKGEIVRQAVLEQHGSFRLADIRAACPSVSLPMIKRVLSAMKSEGVLALNGRGRGATWSIKTVR